MKYFIPLLLVTCVVAGGCGSSDGPSAGEKGLRAKLTSPEIDFDSVPPDQRAKVLGMMKANGSAAKAAELEKKWGMSK